MAAGSRRAVMREITPDSRSVRTRYAHVDSAMPTLAARAAFVMRPSSVSAARMARSTSSSDGCGFFGDTAMRVPPVCGFHKSDCPVIARDASQLAKFCEITDDRCMAPKTLHPDSIAVHAGRDDL